jgi:uncharacterized membrane protein YjjB (DUF3815 family)
MIDSQGYCGTEVSFRRDAGRTVAAAAAALALGFNATQLARYLRQISVHTLTTPASLNLSQRLHLETSSN